MNLDKYKRMNYPIVLIFLLSPWMGFGQTWQKQTISSVGSKPSIAVDSDSKVHIAYMLEDGNGWVRYSTNINGDFEVSQVSQGYFYGPLDLILDQNDSPYIAYHNHSFEDQVVRHLVDGDWEEYRTQDSGHDGWDNAILIDAQGVIHTSSIDPSGFGGRGVEYGKYKNGEWLVEGVGTGGIMYANGTSIALDPVGEPYISYFDDREEVLKLAHRENNQWSIQTVDNANGSGRFSSMLTMENGDIYISYYQDNGAVKLATFINNEWQIHTLDQLADVLIAFLGARNLTSITRYGDLIAVSYADRTRVRFALWQDEIIKRETIATAGDRPFGQITSLAIDPAGIAHLVYSDLDASNKNGNIYYAYRDTSVPVQELSDHEIDFEMYPNPVSQNHTVSLRVPSRGLVSYDVYNIYGQMIQKGSFSKQEKLSTSDWEPGTYLLNIHNNRGESGAHKLLILR